MDVWIIVGGRVMIRPRITARGVMVDESPELPAMIDARSGPIIVKVRFSEPPPADAMVCLVWVAASRRRPSTQAIRVRPLGGPHFRYEALGRQRLRPWRRRWRTPKRTSKPIGEI